MHKPGLWVQRRMLCMQALDNAPRQQDFSQRCEPQMHGDKIAQT